MAPSGQLTNIADFPTIVINDFFGACTYFFSNFHFLLIYLFDISHNI